MVDRDVHTAARKAFDDLVREIRPDLHRFSARMVDSSIEGEDVVQEVLAKAFYQLSELEGVENLRGWLFRSAHNRSVDHLRRADRRHRGLVEANVEAEEEVDPFERQELAALGLSYFTKLTPMQRSCVILKDVLDYSLGEVAEILGASVPAVKGALHRGRAGLRRAAVASGREDVPATLSEAEAGIVTRYAERFNARDFDGLRDMLAEDVRLDLVGRFQAHGAKPVGRYFSNYARAVDCTLRAATFEGRPALIASDGAGAAEGYVILLRYEGDRVTAIRDYRYSRHVFAEGRGE